MGAGNFLFRMFTKKGKKNQNTNADDIRYHWVHRPVGKSGKTKLKKEERPAPPGLTPEEVEVLENVRRRAYRWDQSFTCCCFGFRFGWSAIIGLIPVLGDAFEVLISYLLIRKATSLKKVINTKKGPEEVNLLDDWLVTGMYANIMIDFAAGFIPILGDLLDFWYRANTRNAWILDNFLTELGQKRLQGQTAVEKGGMPSTMQYASDGRDLEQGFSAYATPAVVPPARTPAAKTQQSPAPYRSTPPGRSLTGQRTPNPGGRTPQDPRDRGYR